MKTTVFDFNRVGLLFQRYFTERFHTELIYWSIMVIAFMFIRNSVPAIIGLIFIAGVFYAARFFREIHSPSNGIAYYMIPATQLEKLTVAVVITSFYYFAMMIIAYVTGNLLGTFLNNMLANINFLPGGFNFFHHSPVQWKLFTTVTYNIFGSAQPEVSYNYLNRIFKMILLSQSIYLLGSIYFKNNQFLKTFLATNIIQLLLLILIIIEVRLIFGTAVVSTNIGSSYNFGMIAGKVLRIVIYVLIPFFWVVSYFRLTEKQV